MAEPPKHRPLLSTSGLVALVGGTFVVLLVLLPFAQGRLHKAVLLAPSSLSIRYLRLSLDKRPDDTTLRMDLVKKLIETGQLDDARSDLVRLTSAGDAVGLSARMMLVDLDLRAWRAIVPARHDARASALERVLADMHAIHVARLPMREVERFADHYRELEQPVAAAELLDALAEHGLANDAARIAAADAAWLAAGLPARAAELHAQAAGRQGQAEAQGLAQARLALERTRSAGDPEASARMLERMRGLFPADAGLLELAVHMAEEHDVQSAFDLAALLVATAPREAKYHRLLARLAEATGRGLRALDEYVWLVRHGGEDSDRARAIALAKANWDLPLYRELLGGQRVPEGPPRIATCKRGKGRCRARPRVTPRVHVARRCQVSRPEARARERAPAARLRALHERVALDEALGDTAAAAEKLTNAAGGDFADVSEVWQRKFDLELRLGDNTAALATATLMLERFPGRVASERLAGVQLALDQTHAALQTLLDAKLEPSERDEAWLRKIALVAFEAGDVAAERSAYEALILLPQASFWDYQRLWELARDRADALRVALAAFDRFESPQMFAAAIDLYGADGKEAEQLALFERAERMSAVTASVQYWQARVAMHQQRAVRALERAQYSLATEALATAEVLLKRAAERTKDTGAYEPLWIAQRAQTLSLALATDDAPLIAQAYAAHYERLSLRDRVYVLRRLQRDDEALSLARSGLEQSDLSESDRTALEDTAIELSRNIRRYVGVSGEALHMDGLFMWRGAAAVEYTGGATGLRGEASVTQYQPRASADPVLDADVRDIAAALQGRLEPVVLELGARVRDEKSVRPFGTLAAQLAGNAEAGLLARLQVNELSADTARLRALGVRDALALAVTLRLAEHVYVTSHTAGELFYTAQERDYLGAGLTTDAGLGASLPLPKDIGVAGARLVTRLAPRFAQPSETTWLSQTTEWIGVGASVGRAALDAPPLTGHRFGYMLDAAAGWLWPSNGIGFSAQAGVGTSIFGGDLLTVAARGGNVVGSTAWGVNVGYGFTIDR